MSDVHEQGLESAPEACQRPQAVGDGGDAVVAARDLTRRYGSGDAAVDALRGISIDLARGRFTAIMGPSGSGKSTLMHVLAGLDEPTTGAVWIDGVQITALKERQLTQLRRDKVGFIFQTFNLLPVYTVFENVEFPLLLRGIDAGWRRKMVMDTLEWVGLADRADSRPAQLSGGQSQRVAIARAVVKQPEIVLADEPTANLDAENSHHIMRTMVQLNQTLKATFVFATHDEKVIGYLRRKITLVDGRIAADARV